MTMPKPKYPLISYRSEIDQKAEIAPFRRYSSPEIQQRFTILEKTTTHFSILEIC